MAQPRSAGGGGTMTAEESLRWTKLLDEETGCEYFYDNETGESSWEMPDGWIDPEETAVNVTDSGGMGGPYLADPDYDVCQPLSALVEETDETNFLNDYREPMLASKKDAVPSSRLIWPDAEGAVQLARLEVFFCEDGHYRQRITLDPQEHLDKYTAWEPLFVMYVFAHEVPYARRHSISFARRPRRDKLTDNKVYNRRDMTEWEDREEFWSYPLTMTGTHIYHIDFAGSPDRYMVTQEDIPWVGWSRIMQFRGFPASKYYVLVSEQTDPPTCVVERGLKVRKRPGWRCTLAFYAFDVPLPGANFVKIQEREDPYPRMRFTLQDLHDEHWYDKFTFYTFDVPVPGTARFPVQHTIRDTNTLEGGLEKYRITLEEPRLPWEFKFDFYAFPIDVRDIRSPMTRLETEAKEAEEKAAASRESAKRNAKRVSTMGRKRRSTMAKEGVADSPTGPTDAAASEANDIQAAARAAALKARAEERVT